MTRLLLAVCSASLAGGAGCATAVLASMEPVRDDKQDETYVKGTPVLSSQGARFRVSVAPKAGPTGRYEVAPRIAFYVAVVNLTDKRADVSERSVAVVANGARARVVAATEVEDSILDQAAWAQGVNAFAGALNQVAASFAGQTTFSGKVGGVQFSGTADDHGAVMQARRQAAADTASTASAIRAKEREGLAEVSLLLQRHTIQPWGTFVGTVLVERPLANPGTNAAVCRRDGELGGTCELYLRVTIEGEAHRFLFSELVVRM